MFDGNVILGTRAKKTRTRSFNAFSSIDYPDTAEFRDLRLIPFLPRPREYGQVRFYEKLDPSVFVLRLIPGMRADIIPLLADHCKALILESFGVGGLPGGDDGELFAAVRDWCAAGRLVVFTTQVPHEGSDLGVYEVGRAAKALPGVLEATFTEVDNVYYAGTLLELRVDCRCVLSHRLNEGVPGPALESYTIRCYMPDPNDGAPVGGPFIPNAEAAAEIAEKERKAMEELGMLDPTPAPESAGEN